MAEKFYLSTAKAGDPVYIVDEDGNIVDKTGVYVGSKWVCKRLVALVDTQSGPQYVQPPSIESTIMDKAWAHLPNAIHIDRVLESVRAHPKEWTNGYDCGLSYDTAYDAAWSDAYGRVADTIYTAACNYMYSRGSRGARYVAARDTILALIAYDDSAHLLDSSPEEIRLLIALGHPYAILFLPACTAFSQIGKLASA